MYSPPSKFDSLLDAYFELRDIRDKSEREWRLIVVLSSAAFFLIGVSTALLWMLFQR
jgi:hypothetical protein